MHLKTDEKFFLALISSSLIICFGVFMFVPRPVTIEDYLSSCGQYPEITPKNDNSPLLKEQVSGITECRKMMLELLIQRGGQK